MLLEEVRMRSLGLTSAVTNSKSFQVLHQHIFPEGYMTEQFVRQLLKLKRQEEQARKSRQGVPFRMKRELPMKMK